MAPQKKHARKASAAKVARYPEPPTEYKEAFLEAVKLTKELELDLKKLKVQLQSLCFHPFGGGN